MRRIVKKFLGQIEGYVASRFIKIEWNTSLISYLEKEGFDPAMGARPLGRLINEKIKLPMSKVLLENKVDWIHATYDNENKVVKIKHGTKEVQKIVHQPKEKPEMETN